jgi:chromosome segregation ATPase
LEEIDELKEQANVREMKLETINFRCEKLQEDITKKHEQITLLKNKNLEQAEVILELNSKLEKAQRENRINREDVGPRLDALRSRYEVCMLEMVSLENDNKILMERNKKILKQDTELRKINRDLKREKFEEKQERLELCKNFEKVKREFEELNEKLEDMRIQKDELEEMAKRVKNEKDSGLRKIEVLERENFRLNTLKNQHRFTEVDRVSDSKDTVFMDISGKGKQNHKKLSYGSKFGKN